MPFCGSCGAVIVAGEVFCGECGTPVPKVEGGGKSEEDRLMRTMNKFAPSLAAPNNPAATKPSPIKLSPAPSPTHAPKPTPQYTSPPPKPVVQQQTSPPPKPVVQQQTSSPARSSGAKYCPECGNQVSSAGAFCSECGYSASSGSSGSSAPSAPSGGTVLLSEAPICNQCRKEIEGGAYEFQGNSYHESCWRCEGCRGSLNGVAFGLKDGRPWCKDCNFGRPKEYCPSCGKLIAEGTFTKALGQTYHSGCFKCQKCQKPIGQGTGGFFEKNGQIICKSCN